MASPACFTTLVLSYVTITVGLAFASTLETGSVMSATSLEMEAEALLRAGWWSWYGNDTSQRCKWTGISCNKAGSITRIRASRRGLSDELEKLNFSSFPNLHSREADVPAFDRSFKNEAKILSEIRHKNIVRLHGFCLHRRCMFLIYEYMSRGSLSCVFACNTEALEIIKDTACALSYLHHDCQQPIVHRDISSNNILLNSNLEACVSDFGTTKLLDHDSSNQTMFENGKFKTYFIYVLDRISKN